MSKDTQLPAEALPKTWLDDIELKAEHEASLQFHPVYSPDQNTACRICYRNGAKEYATAAYQAHQEIESLKYIIERWESKYEELFKTREDYRLECERLAKVAEHWQQEYYKLTPPHQPLKIDDNPIA